MIQNSEKHADFMHLFQSGVKGVKREIYNRI